MRKKGKCHSAKFALGQGMIGHEITNDYHFRKTGLTPTGEARVTGKCHYMEKLVSMPSEMCSVP